MHTARQWMLSSAACLLVFGGVLAAQTPLGSLVGTVRDAGRGVVPDAAVTVKDQNRGYTRTVKTNASGDYVADVLLQGTYTVSCEVPGFKKFVQSNIPLRDGETLRIDVSMEVGDVSQSVSVTEAAPVVASETAEVVSNGATRQQFNYELIAPGGYQTTTPAYGAYSAVVYNGKAAGAPGQQSASRIDGMDLYLQNTPVSADFIQEVKLSYAGANADAASPLSVSATTRGGTNALHGKVDALFTNPALNSLGPQGDSASRHGQTTTRSYYYQVGGPVYIPKIYNGKNRTFFWFGLSKQSTMQPYVNQPAHFVPPLNWRTGDFSQAPASAFTTRNPVLINPFSGQPFPNNKIPASMLDKTAQALNQYYPAPNFGAGAANPNTYAGLNQLTTSGYQGSNVFGAGENWVRNIKIDHVLTKSDTIGFTYMRNKGAFGWDYSDVGAWAITQANLNKMYTGYWTHSFAPAIVNELRFGYSSFGGGWGTVRAGSTQYVSLGSGFAFAEGGYDMLSQLGIRWKPEGVTGAPSNSLPTFCISDIFSPFCGTGGNETVAISDRALWNWVDNLTIRHGSHSFKMGGEVYWKRDDAYVTHAFGRWNFDGRFSGVPYSDFLLGLPSTTQNEPLPPQLSVRGKRVAAYFMDSWKVTPRLTLELGLRFERYATPYESHGLDVNWNPATGAVIIRNQSLLSKVDPNYPKSISIVTAAQAGYPETLRKLLQPLFYPRLGVAFRPFNNAKTVMRGAFGVFPVGAQNTGVLAPTEANQGVIQPWVLNQSFTNVFTNGTPLLSTAQPFPSSPGQAPAQVAFGAIPNFPIPYTFNWSLTVEREIFANTGVRISYLGSKGTQLPYKINVGAPPPGALPYRSDCVAQRAGTCVGPNYTNFTSATLATAGGNSIYHGLDLEVHRRWSAGLEFMVNYMWARSLQDAQDAGIIAVFNGNQEFGAPIEDPRNRRRDRGLTNGSLSQRLVVDHVWNLPFGKGMRWLNSNTVLDHILGHWIFLGRWQATSAPPYTPVWNNIDWTNTNAFSGRPDVIPGCQANVSNKTVSQTWNPSCFALPSPGRYGNAGVNLIWGVAPGVWSNTQINLFKSFTLLTLPPFSEGVRFRVGASLTNPINHPYLAPFTTAAIWSSSPAVLVNSPTAGQGYMTGNRSVQVTARIEF